LISQLFTLSLELEKNEEDQIFLDDAFNHERVPQNGCAK